MRRSGIQSCFGRLTKVRLPSTTSGTTLWKITRLVVLHLLSISYLPWPELLMNLRNVSTIEAYLDFGSTTSVVGYSFYELKYIDQPLDSGIVPPWISSPCLSWMARRDNLDWDYNLRKPILHRICNISFTHPPGLKLSGPILPCPSEFRYFFVLGSNDKSFALTWFQDE